VAKFGGGVCKSCVQQKYILKVIFCIDNNLHTLFIKFFYLGENNIVTTCLEHNHNVQNSAAILRQEINNGVKRKAQEDICQRPAKLIHMEISAVASKNPSVAILDISEINNIRRNMYVARRSTLPPMPKNIQGVHNALNTVLMKTVRNEEFLLVNDIDSNIIIFSCYTNLNFLCSVETWYMDGTFQYCAKYFYQLYTIHGYKSG
jgi:hypothetical protein